MVFNIICRINIDLEITIKQELQIIRLVTGVRVYIVLIETSKTSKKFKLNKSLNRSYESGVHFDL